MSAAVDEATDEILALADQWLDVLNNVETDEGDDDGSIRQFRKTMARLTEDLRDPL